MAQNLEVLKLAGMIFDLTKEENRHCIYNFPNLNLDLQDRSVDLEFNYDKKEDNLYFSIEIRSENLIVNSDCGVYKFCYAFDRTLFKEGAGGGHKKSCRSYKKPTYHSVYWRSISSNFDFPCCWFYIFVPVFTSL